MKPINIQGQEYYYDIHHMNGNSVTKFYVFTGMVKRRKYYLFGPEVEVPSYKNVFDIPNFNIESAYISKEEAKRRVTQHSDLIHRSQQILKGELI